MLDIPAPSEFICDNFFYIDSRNCDLTESKLYGYYIAENGIFINTTHNKKLLAASTAGCFVNVVRENNIVYIQQDFHGGYGLYLYEKNGFFAISNSLMLLIANLRDSYDAYLSIDKEFIDHLISSRYGSYSHERTYIKDIRQIDLNRVFCIDVNSKAYYCKTVKQERGDVLLDSEEAFNLIDVWHNKYNSLLMSLINDGYTTTMHLTGGKDSRIALTCAAGKINPASYSNFSFKTSPPISPSHEEDLRISQKICSILDLPLNRSVCTQIGYLDPAEVISIPAYSIWLYLAQINLSNEYYLKPIFTFTGCGGEGLRRHWDYSLNEMIEMNTKFKKFETYDFNASTASFIKSDLSKVIGKYYTNMSEGHQIYIATRMRYNFLKESIEFFLHNEILIHPLLDPVLFRIYLGNESGNHDLLSAVIIDRFIPEIDDIEVQGGRNFDDAIVAKAKQLNAKYPYSSSEQINQDVFYYQSSHYPHMIDMQLNKIRKDLEKDYYSSFIKKFCIKNFGADFYQYCMNFLYQHKFRSNTYINLIWQLCLLCKFISHRYNNSAISLPRKYDYFNGGIYYTLFRIFNSLRIIIKYDGDNETIPEIIKGKSLFYRNSSPSWVNDTHGRGIVLQTDQSNCDINFTFICNSAGTCTMKFSSVDARPTENDVLNMKIDLMKLCIMDADGKIFYSTQQQMTVGNKNFFQQQFPVTVLDEVTVSLSFLPHDYAFDEFTELFCRLYRQQTRSSND